MSYKLDSTGLEIDQILSDSKNPPNAGMHVISKSETCVVAGTLYPIADHVLMTGSYGATLINSGTTLKFSEASTMQMTGSYKVDCSDNTAMVYVHLMKNGVELSKTTFDFTSQTHRQAGGKSYDIPLLVDDELEIHVSSNKAGNVVTIEQHYIKLSFIKR